MLFSSFKYHFFTYFHLARQVNLKKCKKPKFVNVCVDIERDRKKDVCLYHMSCLVVSRVEGGFFLKSLFAPISRVRASSVTINKKKIPEKSEQPIPSSSKVEGSKIHTSSGINMIMCPRARSKKKIFILGTKGNTSWA